MNNVYIGIDIAKATFVAAIQEPSGPKLWGTFANTQAGFEQWRTRLHRRLEAQPVANVVVVVDPTGGFELALAGFVAEQGWQVSRPNARKVRDWAKSQGQRGKTDAQDACLLARYGAAQPLAAWRPLPTAYSELESLLLRQDDLEKLLQTERNRQAALGLKAGTAPIVASNLALVLTALEQALAQIQAAIKAHVKAHPAVQAKARRLRTVPGIGAKSVLFVLVLLARWDTLTAGAGQAKGLTAYAGLDPKRHDSGTSVHKPAHISRMGNRATRRRLYMCAFGGVRAKSGPLREFYCRLVGRGKAKKLAITAGARKILTWAWAVYRSDTDFDRARHVTANPQLELA